MTNRKNEGVSKEIDQQNTAAYPTSKDLELHLASADEELPLADPAESNETDAFDKNDPVKTAKDDVNYLR